MFKKHKYVCVYTQGSSLIRRVMYTKTFTLWGAKRVFRKRLKNLGGRNIIEYNESYNFETKLITDVIAIHKRGKRLWIHTKTYDIFIYNKDIKTLEIIERTSINYENYNCNFDAVLDCPVRANFYDEDKSYV